MPIPSFSSPTSVRLFVFLALCLTISWSAATASEIPQEEKQETKSAADTSKPENTNPGAAGQSNNGEKQDSSGKEQPADQGDAKPDNSNSSPESTVSTTVETVGMPDEWFDNERWFQNVDDTQSVFDPLDSQFGKVVVTPVSNVFFYDIYYFDNSRQTVFGSVGNLSKAIKEAQKELKEVRQKLELDPVEEDESDTDKGQEDEEEEFDLKKLRNGLKTKIQAAFKSILESKLPTEEIKKSFIEIKTAFFDLDFAIRNSESGELTQDLLIKTVEAVTPVVEGLSAFNSQSLDEMAWTLCPDISSDMRTSFFRGFGTDQVETLVSGYREFEDDLEKLIAGEKLIKENDSVKVVEEENEDGDKVDVKFTAITIPFIVCWLVLGAIFFTIRMSFINIRGFFHAVRVTKGDYDDPNDPGEISHFQALSSALSATVGLGNIAGVAIAVSMGGPGAIVWMVIAGFLGMTSKFTECTLGQMYRKVDEEGRVLGGPMRYLSAGLAEMKLGLLGKLLAVMFVILCIGGSFGGGNMFQANQSYAAVKDAVPWFEGKAWLYGIILAFLVGLVILGGIKRIGTAAGLIVPLMCLVYVLAGLFVIVWNAAGIPEAFMKMIGGAFSLKAGFGGLVGTLVVGFQRAAFSNEAGTGSASIAHSAAATDEPVREGIVALLEPFIDTIVVCTMTGLVVVVTGAYDSGAGDGVVMTSSAFKSVLPWFPYVLSVAVVLFAFSTMISWSYYGERCAIWLFGESASVPYKFLFLIFVFLGAVLNLGNVLGFSDLMILGMAFPNILGLLLLSGKVRRALNEYMEKLDRGDFDKAK